MKKINPNHIENPDRGRSDSVIKKSISGLQDLTMSLKNKFTMAQYDFANVIQEMMKDLSKMEGNTKIPQFLIDKKKQEIERLVKFNNTADLIFQEYQQNILVLKMTNRIIEQTFLESTTIDEMILKNRECINELLKP